MIYEFEGQYVNNEHSVIEPLGLEHTLWANTVLASSGYIIGMVIYTGAETRAMMNQSNPRSKVGLIDEEINFLSKILFILMLFFAGTIVVLNGFHGNWGLMFFRFVLLLCSIIPISLRVNLDLAKIWYSYSIDKDKEITETITRNSSIPEELGRIEVLFTDKTGTLTQNDMVMKKICLEFMTFSSETLGEVKEMLQKTTGPF